MSSTHDNIEISAQYRLFYNQAKPLFGDRIYIDYLRRFCYGTDASCYRYIPQIVIKAYNEDEIKSILHLSLEYKLPLTFRAYGSSLSGQACGYGILVIATFKWKDIDIFDDSIRLGCGVIGSDANESLKNLNKKIGPDPATIAMASIGGIVANNSSGMCCGVKQNSYQTIKSIRVILSDGYVLDTDSQENVADFLQTHKKLCDDVMELRERVLSDETLCALIKRKYKIKNTTGYSLNALIDFDNPIDIITHLFVGSEGTLGFISHVRLEIVDDEPFKACALLFYKDMKDSAKTIQILAKHDDIISSAEIMDYYSLKSVQHLDGLPQIVREVQEGNACILIQTQSNDKATLEKQVATIQEALSGTNPICAPLYSTDEREYSKWWSIRKGLLPIASATRPKGSSVITEDVCFEIDTFGEGIEFLESLFEKHHFKDSGIIFGHALSGNVHFIITPNLGDSKQKEDFENLVNDMAEGVANFGGSIKAEHGTGRMVAPFVELEWGQKAYALNRAIKDIFDPHGLLNPDVIITDDPLIHTKNIKEMPLVNDYIDKCMECGFCEKACPSGHFTLTPRQRITVMREMQRLKNLGDTKSMELYSEMKKSYEYVGDETCAACSQCSTLCPLDIDTANIALTLRQRHNHSAARKILHNIDSSVSFARTGLKIAAIFGNNFLNKVSLAYRKISTKLPYMPMNLPRANDYFVPMLRKQTSMESGADSRVESSANPSMELKTESPAQTKQKVVYFSTCINRAFKPSKLLSKNGDSRSIQEVFISLCRKSGVEIIYPQGLENMCCGKAFVDYDELQQENKQKLLSILKNASQNGAYPIVLDHSACSVHAMKILHELRVMDMPFFIYEHLVPRLKLNPANENIALYSMCALKKKNLSLLPLAKLCTSGEIVIHSGTYCCGFAGNKGFFTPELNANALEELSEFYASKNIQHGFGSSSTCEIGLSDKTNFAWQHIAYLVDKISEQK